MKNIIKIIIGLGIICLLVVMGIIIYPCVQGDPFGSSLKGSGMNCGPEYRQKFNIAINSKEDFVNFLKENKDKILDKYGNKDVGLDSFREGENNDINWDKVLLSVKTIKVCSRTIYILDYNNILYDPISRRPVQYCGGFTTKMTNDGYISVYGCCGV